MRVFVFEYVSGGGLANRPMVPSLFAEGDMMLTAVVRDLVRVPGVEVTICRDRRFDAPALPVAVSWVESTWHDAWMAGVAEADAVLPIAPETDGILELLCDDVQRAGKVLLNSRANAVAIAGSKLATYRRLAAAGVPVVATCAADGGARPDATAFVIKPDQGIGCQGIRLIPGEDALDDLLAHWSMPGTWLIQPYVKGIAASLSVIVGEHCNCVLGINQQRVAQVDDGFVLLGSIVNGLVERAPEILPLAAQVCGAIDGLWGYVGIDLVIGEQGPQVLEVNPRMTTSYVGLSESVGRNVGALLLQLSGGDGCLPESYQGGTQVHVDLEFGRAA
ncbi:MAG: ATP-grasp domain-containing protein [Gammaproteobacteria bacterium]|nr:ATP-grasp domain-containing protein [Gammaproteobacteria bacterium]